ERVDRAHTSGNFQISRSRFVRILCFTRKEEVWVLNGEGVNFCFVSFILKLFNKALIVRCQAASERMCCSHKNDLFFLGSHQISFSIRYWFRVAELLPISSPRNPAKKSCIPMIMQV